MTAKPPTIVGTVANLRPIVADWRRAGHRYALVPTMGALHRGHLKLVDAGRATADRVIVSIFVNPRQFGPDEDFDRYPRDLMGDAGKLADAGADLIFAPDVAEMYPDGFATSVTVAGPSAGLCGAARPGHFEGVATVVAKLLFQVAPDIALFGEKDYQQLLVIRRLVADLDIPVEIAGVPIVREADGLAMSSRNAYLDPDRRKRAPALFATLTRTAGAIAAGQPAANACRDAADALLTAGFDSVDYVEARDAESLGPFAGPDRPGRLLAAARIGGVRLIDNVPIPAPDREV